MKEKESPLETYRGTRSKSTRMLPKLRERSD
jgi:hypothetical protein